MRQWVIGVALIGCLSCGSGTTYWMKNGQSVSGTTVSETANSVIIHTESGKKARVEKCQVESVDHAGKGATIAGLVLFGIGSAVLASGLAPQETRDPENSRALVIDSIPLLMTGGGLIGWGATTWVESSDSAQNVGEQPCGTPGSAAEPLQAQDRVSSL